MAGAWPPRTRPTSAHVIKALLERTRADPVTVDRQCGSSQQAVHFAAQAVLSGTADLVVAAACRP